MRSVIIIYHVTFIDLIIVLLDLKQVDFMKVIDSSPYYVLCVIEERLYKK